MSQNKPGIKQQIQSADTISEVESLLAIARTYKDMPTKRLRLCERTAEKRVEQLEKR
jgi:hypothetical protein